MKQWNEFLLPPNKYLFQLGMCFPFKVFFAAHGNLPVDLLPQAEPEAQPFGPQSAFLGGCFFRESLGKGLGKSGKKLVTWRIIPVPGLVSGK